MRTLELTRVLSDDDLQFEDLHTRKAVVLRRSEFLTGVYDGKYTVLLGAEDSGMPMQKARPGVLRDLSSISAKHRQELERRYDYVKTLERKKISRGRRREIAKLIETVSNRRGESKRPSTSTVMKWFRDYQSNGNNPFALVSRHCFKTQSKRIRPEIEKALWQVLRRSYFTRDRYSIRHAYNQLQLEIKRLNSRGAPEASESQVSYSTFSRRIREVDLYHRVAAREGPARARMVCRTAFPDGSPAYPMERVEIDHTVLNWVVICERTGLPLGRPVLTVMLDAYSGYVLGFYLSFYGPGLTSVSGAIQCSIRAKSDYQISAALTNQWLSYGLADEICVDNGLEFHSFGFKQIAMALRSDIMYCRVRTPWLKPRIERFFEILNHLTLAKGRVVPRIANVLRVDPYKDAAITFSDLVKGLLQFFVDVHPFEPNWRKMATPYELFAEGIEKCPPARYPGSLQELKLASGMSKQLSLNQGGIELLGLPYGSVDFKQIVNQHGSRIKVLCKWDPDDMSTLFVKNPGTHDWVTAHCRWPHYANGLSFNQHRLIRQFARSDLKSTERVEYLLKAKCKLHDHWLNSTARRQRSDALTAGRYRDLTSSQVLEPSMAPQAESATPAHPDPERLIAVDELEMHDREIPDFETFVM